MQMSLVLFSFARAVFALVCRLIRVLLIVFLKKLARRANLAFCLNP